MKKKKSREMWKKSEEELQQYLLFRRRSAKLPNRKEYNRQKTKKEGRDYEN